VNKAERRPAIKWTVAVLVFAPIVAFAQTIDTTPPTPILMTSDDVNFTCAYPNQMQPASNPLTTFIGYKATDGKIESINVSKSSGNNDFDSAAVLCVTERHTSSTPMSSDRTHSIAVLWTNISGNPMGRAYAVGFPPHPISPQACRSPNPVADQNVRMNGPTRVKLKILPNGSVASAEIVKSSGDPNLDNVRAACTSAWHFQPATIDGTAISSAWQVDVKWDSPPGQH
jgi:TonB family protein